MAGSSRILIAEDDDLFRELCMLMLQRARPTWHLTETVDGHAAYRHYQQHGADLILANDVMPVMSGIALAATLRADGAHTPIMLLVTRATTPPAVAHDPYTRVVAKSIGAERLVQLLDHLLIQS